MKKRVLFVCGCLLVALGTVGIFLPVLPTTPFLLLAASCFSGSSEKAHRFLLKSPLFGAYILHYKTGRGVSVGAKVKAVTLLWALLALGAFAMAKTWAYIAFPVIGAGVTCHLLMIKTARSEKKPCSNHDAHIAQQACKEDSP